MSFNFVASGKCIGERMKKDLERDGQKCRFGYCWWFWFPRLNIRIKTRYKMFAIIWLRFCWSLEWLGKSRL